MSVEAIPSSIRDIPGRVATWLFADDDAQIEAIHKRAANGLYFDVSATLRGKAPKQAICRVPAADKTEVLDSSIFLQKPSCGANIQCAIDGLKPQESAEFDEWPDRNRPLSMAQPDESPFERGLGLFGREEDAALLDEVVKLAYEERRHPNTPARSV
jgi:hypothetical protein